jgi:hypothetical protein
MSTDGSIEELHVFANRIHLRREWFQKHHIMPHYDLTVSKREAAIKAGAIYVHIREQLKRLRAKREVPTIETDLGMEWLPTSRVRQ